MYIIKIVEIVKIKIWIDSRTNIRSNMNGSRFYKKGSTKMTKDIFGEMELIK